MGLEASQAPTQVCRVSSILRSWWNRTAHIVHLEGAITVGFSSIPELSASPTGR